MKKLLLALCLFSASLYGYQPDQNAPAGPPNPLGPAQPYGPTPPYGPGITPEGYKGPIGPPEGPPGPSSGLIGPSGAVK